MFQCGEDVQDWELQTQHYGEVFTLSWLGQVLSTWPSLMDAGKRRRRQRMVLSKLHFFLSRIQRLEQRLMKIEPHVAALLEVLPNRLTADVLTADILEQLM